MSDGFSIDGLVNAWERVKSFVLDEATEVRASNAYADCVGAVMQAEQLERYWPSAQAALAKPAQAPDFAARVLAECGDPRYQRNVCRLRNEASASAFSTIEGKICTPVKGDPADPDCFAVVHWDAKTLSLRDFDKFGVPEHLSELCR